MITAILILESIAAISLIYWVYRMNVNQIKTMKLMCDELDEVINKNLNQPEKI